MPTCCGRCCRIITTFETNYAVGDIPREADILVVHRTSAGPPPFRGLWRHLTTWNVFEFKGPTVAARVRDLDLLVEVGLGVDRRLNEDRVRQRQAALEPEQVSFWYIVRGFGLRFQDEARRRLAQLEEIAPGLWRGQALRRLVLLVNSERFATEPDSVPLHLLVRRATEQERELARLVIEQRNYLAWYQPVLAGLHPEAWAEVETMARAKSKGLKFDFNAVVRYHGLHALVEACGGLKTVVKAFGPKNVVKEIGLDGILASLTPEERQKLKEKLK